MRSQDFDTLAQIVRHHSGLVLTPEKEYLLESRLLPVARKWNLDTVEQLAQRLRAKPDEAQIRAVTEAMTTNESSFFRDSKPFDLFRETMLPALRKARLQRRSLRIWSAAASTGQEAYSLAMLLKEHAADLAGWTIDIVGTDLSTEVLDRARAAQYTQFEVQRGLPTKLLVKYFRQSGERWCLTDDIRNMVQFKHLNLLHDFSQLGQFDIVFCRNVLIYFDRDTKARVLQGIRRQMPADGYLVLGGAETVLGVTDHFQAAAGVPGLYSPTVQGLPLARAGAL